MRSLFWIGISIVFIGMLPACNLDRKVERTYKKSIAHAPFDVIIVPGYQYITDTADRNRLLLNVRLFWAKELYDKGIARNIIFSGSSVHSPYGEGKLMKLYADALGIPAEHTFVESEALHTTENLAFGRRMAHKLGFKKIAIATDPYQFSYTTAFRWIEAPGARLLSFSRDSMKKYIRPLPNIDISGSFIKDFVPLKDR